MRGMLRAFVAVATFGFALSADAQILQRFGIGGDGEPESVLKRVRDGEFNDRCNATVAGAEEQEQREQAEQAARQQSGRQAPSPDVYNLLDLLLNAPAAAAQNVRTIPSTAMDPAFRSISARIVDVQPPPQGVNLRITVQSAEDIDARQVEAGEILLSQGLINALRNRPDPNITGLQITNEYAFIVAHEYAHVLMCHYNRPLAQERNRQAFRNMSTVGLLIAVVTNSTMTRSANGMVVTTDDDDAGKDMLTLLAATTLLSEFNSSIVNPAWGRGQERDADRLAVELMLAAGYRPSYAPAVITDLFNADRSANERFRAIAASVPQQALGAMLLSLGERNGGDSLEARLRMVLLSAGLQMFQQWRINQRRHFHDNAERRGERIAEMDRFASLDTSAGGAVAAGVFDDGDAAQGAALRAGYSADLGPPDLARQALQALMAGDFDTGCARAAEALRAGPNLVDALMVSAECELHRENKAGAARHFTAALRQDRATPGDFMTVAGIWSQFQERGRADEALAAGGRRFSPDRFYVERINIAGEFDDLTAVGTITTECQSSQIPEVRENCTRRQAELINAAAEAAQQAGAQQQGGSGNPLSSLLRGGQNALGRLTGGGAQTPNPDAAQSEEGQAQTPPPEGGP
jgi:Zn-dependent protease with chaperone function